MSIRLYKSYTPGTRNRALSAFTDITKTKPEKTLVTKNHRNKGRNNRGVITIRHRGGGHKRRYRIIDFKRNKYGLQGTVRSIEYDPNRNARIALIHYLDGEKRYILHPKNLNVGDSIISGSGSPLTVGNTLPLEEIPLGTSIHNIELIAERRMSNDFGNCRRAIKIDIPIIRTPFFRPARKFFLSGQQIPQGN